MSSNSISTPAALSKLTPTFARGLTAVGRFLRWRPRWLIAFAAVAIGCGLLAFISSNSRENRALQRVRDLGGYTSESKSYARDLSKPAVSSPLRLLGRLLSIHVVTGLVVKGKPATDADIAEFVAAFPNLTQVDVSSTQVTDRSLMEIAKLPGLAQLASRHVPVTDAAIAPLGAHPNLTIVYLDGTQITDAGMEELAKLPKLSWLGVSRTAVTDAGLAHLSGMSLNQLDVSGTQVTDAGVAAFQAAHPQCRVVR